MGKYVLLYSKKDADDKITEILCDLMYVFLDASECRNSKIRQ